MVPNIKNIVPIDWYELIIIFDDSEIRSFEPSKANLYKEYNFLAYPNRLKGYKFDANKISWFNGISFDKDFIYKNSQSVDAEQLKWKSLSIGSKNQAPTDKHPSHHVYDIAIRPFNKENPIILSESIGGGLGDMGGSINYSIEELLKNNDWKSHFIKSDCKWAIDIIEKYRDNLDNTMIELVDGVLERNNPNN